MKRVFLVSRLLVVAALSLTASCSEPVIGEVVATAASCRNGVDDDADGNADCYDQRCRDAGFCDAFETDCTTSPQSGCPIGMGCYATFDQATGTTAHRCRIEGVGVTGTNCDLSRVYMASDAHQCRAGFACSGTAGIAECHRYCTSNSDCDAGGLCIGMGDDASCTNPCSPLDPLTCDQTLVCTSAWQFDGFSFDHGGAYWSCQPAARTRGTATVGMPCDNPTTSSSAPSDICINSLACVPDALGNSVCTEVCAVGSLTCAAMSKSCHPFYPITWPSAFGSTVFGRCL